MEELLIKSNGQWELSKAESKFGDLRAVYSHSEKPKEDKGWDTSLDTSHTAQEQLDAASPASVVDRDHIFDIVHNGKHLGSFPFTTSHWHDEEKANHEGSGFVSSKYDPGSGSQVPDKTWTHVQNTLKVNDKDMLAAREHLNTSVMNQHDGHELHYTRPKKNN